MLIRLTSKDSRSWAVEVDGCVILGRCASSFEGSTRDLAEVSTLSTVPLRKVEQLL